MSSKGNKGSMGIPGDVAIPQWSIDIINFRNDKYWEDIQRTNNSFLVDNVYDKIDSTLNEMMSFIMSKMFN